MISDAEKQHIPRGVLCGAGAGALWGLVFLAPALVSDFSPVQLAAGRYLAYGFMAAVLLAPRWTRALSMPGRKDWIALIWLSLLGNIVYYILLSRAVQTGGIALTSLIIGFLPVAVTLIGTRDAHAPSVRSLMPSLCLCVAGTFCIGYQAFLSDSASPHTLQGVICAVGALVSWTAYAVGNTRCLSRLHHISVQDWNLLTGIVTGALSLVLLPVVLFVTTAHHSGARWLYFFGVSSAVALLASICGNALWNKMSRLVPLTLVGQMILFETLFALIYGFVWEQRWPRLMEVVAFVLVTASVVLCLTAHKKKPASS
ncbi:multidrug DMT transporter permease [Acetobacter sp. DmW_043]|uniref:DMT family transporter n=1 Tax=Acetobacter sp. DmW_043 TaxID=1670658 RepID=UPI000A3A5805|nr:DMT family transporter [Acetobacter sp. DmW_043]OUI88365.1 multidrug DMT transporter permease [Acetobacter sp. DmW_043]